MNLSMSGLDYGLAPIALRERLSFTRSQAGELSGEIRRSVPGVQGCVIISTCNRTEIYLSCQPGVSPEPGAVLCALGPRRSPPAVPARPAAGLPRRPSASRGAARRFGAPWRPRGAPPEAGDWGLEEGAGGAALGGAAREVGWDWGRSPRHDGSTPGL